MPAAAPLAQRPSSTGLVASASLQPGFGSIVLLTALGRHGAVCLECLPSLAALCRG